MCAAGFWDHQNLCKSTTDVAQCPPLKGISSNIAKPKWDDSNTRIQWKIYSRKSVLTRQHLAEANIPSMFDSMGQFYCLLHLSVVMIIIFVIIIPINTHHRHQYL